MSFVSNLLLIASAYIATAEDIQAVPPPNLLPQYPRNDSRVLTLYSKSFKHQCSYPTDPFNCDDALDKTPWKPSYRWPTCSKCYYEKELYPGHGNWHAMFCSRDLIDGFWNVTFVDYDNANCTEINQHYYPSYSAYFGPQIYDRRCFLHPWIRDSTQSKCSSAQQQARCIDGPVGHLFCDLYGSTNKTACDNAPVDVGPTKTMKTCEWFDGVEWFGGEAYRHEMDQAGNTIAAVFV